MTSSVTGESDEVSVWSADGARLPGTVRGTEGQRLAQDSVATPTTRSVAHFSIGSGGPVFTRRRHQRFCSRQAESL